MAETKEGVTVEEDLARGFKIFFEGAGLDPAVAELGATRTVDLIKELVSNEATARADDAMGVHLEEHNHDLLYEVGQ